MYIYICVCVCVCLRSGSVLPNILICAFLQGVKKYSRFQNANLGDIVKIECLFKL